MALKKQKGISLVEVGAIVVIIGFLICIIFLALDPVARYKHTRDIIRQNAVQEISKALKSYQANNGNFILPSITSTKVGETYLITTGKSLGCAMNNRVCQKPIDGETHCVDVSGLLNGEYLEKIPVSPSATIRWDEGKQQDQNGTGFTLTRNSDGSVTVQSCEAETKLKIESN